jgi:hypothetical protein
MHARMYACMTTATMSSIPHAPYVYIHVLALYMYNTRHTLYVQYMHVLALYTGKW